jgi:S1-C subfamily serine protease
MRIVTRARFAQLVVRALAVVVPLALVPVLASVSVGFLARRGAALLWSLGTKVPRPSLALEGALESTPSEVWLPTFSDDPTGARQSAVVRAAEPRARSGFHPESVTARRGSHRIHVGPDLIRRALPASGRPAASWTNRTQDHPAGMLISNPGALSGTISVGDVVFEAEGRSFESFEELVAIVGQAYQRRAKIVTGRLWRRGEPWTLTVEPGWVTQAPRARE